MVTKSKFDVYNGRDVFIYVITCGVISVGVLDYGATINFIKYKNLDVALGFNKIENYLACGSYVGANIGRNANRIKDAKFFLFGVEYKLSANEGNNQHHGGICGFDKKFYNANIFENRVIFYRLSPDGEEGYPGNLEYSIEIGVKDNGFYINYRAKSDKTTIFNPTCHAYLNLDGEGKSALNNKLKLNSSYYTPTDKEHIPTGAVLPVYGTPFDFNIKKTVNFHFKDKLFASEILLNNGYDHNYLTNDDYCEIKKEIKYIASIFSSDDSLELQIYSDAPAFQLYTSGSLIAKNGKSCDYKPGYGICIEPQFVPNAINSDKFLKPVLKKDEDVEHSIQYIFIEH